MPCWAPQYLLLDVNRVGKQVIKISAHFLEQPRADGLEFHDACMCEIIYGDGNNRFGKEHDNGSRCAHLLPLLTDSMCIDCTPRTVLRHTVTSQVYQVHVAWLLL